MREDILTRKSLYKLGLADLPVITANMFAGYTHIGYEGFKSCTNLTYIEIPNTVTSIGDNAFICCNNLKTVVIPNSVTHIGDWAFCGCRSLTSIIIPDSVTHIGDNAFEFCDVLTSVVIPNSVTNIGYDAFCDCNFMPRERTDDKGRIIAYKGFNTDMTCRGFQYKEGETYEIKGKPIICEHGFHACLNPLDCFGYYCGEIGKDVVFHEVYLDGRTNKKQGDSKVVAKKITIGREITLSEMADIASGRK